MGVSATNDLQWFTSTSTCGATNAVPLRYASTTSEAGHQEKDARLSSWEEILRDQRLCTCSDYGTSQLGQYTNEVTLQVLTSGCDLLPYALSARDATDRPEVVLLLCGISQFVFLQKCQNVPKDMLEMMPTFVSSTNFLTNSSYTSSWT